MGPQGTGSAPIPKKHGTQIESNASKSSAGIESRSRSPTQSSDSRTDTPKGHGKSDEHDTEEQATNHDDHTVFENLAGIVRTSAADNGVNMWTHVTGEQGSSTRMEIAAAVLALDIKKAIFIGSDSKSMVDEAKLLNCRSHGS